MSSKTAQKGSLETHTNSKQNEKEYAGPHRSDSNFLYFCVHLLGVRIAVVFSGAKKSRHHKDVWIFVLSEGCDITYRCHACAWNCRVIEPNGFDPTYESPKKETIRMDGFFWYPNTIDQLLTRTGILRRLRRLRVASAFVLTAGQNQRHCIPLPCLRMELPGDRTQWVRSDIRITKKETIRMDGFLWYPNTIDQLLTRAGILRRLRRLRVASAFVLTAGQNQRHCIPLPCLRMELPGDRTQWVRSDIRITKKETIRMDGFFFGDPYGNRTHITAVKGRCLNLLTNGPGSGNLTRTDDTPGMNRMLYQLSYAAIFTCAASHGHDVL